jgi:16S rRNA (cytidine1402-2'-O)-methyltransferase
MARLILVPTPLGNLEDITLRALRLFKEATLIYAEDTRTTGSLLKKYDIKKSILPYHLHNEHKMIDTIIDRIKQEEMVLLVSDAGTPSISDPGFLLVRACIDANITVECLPGPSALIPALVASGLPCDRFVFEGFLPHKKGRQTKVAELAQESRTVVLYESPHRILKCLQQFMEVCGPDRKACVVREISKMFETYHRGTLAELTSYFDANPAKGEIVFLLDGKSGHDLKVEKTEPLFENIENVKKVSKYKTKIANNE